MWDATNFKLKINFTGHTAYVNSVAISPDGSLCASGSKDGCAILWDLNFVRHINARVLYGIVGIYLSHSQNSIAPTVHCIK